MEMGAQRGMGNYRVLPPATSSCSDRATCSYSASLLHVTKCCVIGALLNSRIGCACALNSHLQMSFADDVFGAPQDTIHDSVSS